MVLKCWMNIKKSPAKKAGLLSDEMIITCGQVLELQVPAQSFA